MRVAGNDLEQEYVTQWQREGVDGIGEVKRAGDVRAIAQGLKRALCGLSPSRRATTRVEGALRRDAAEPRDRLDLLAVSSRGEC